MRDYQDYKDVPETDGRKGGKFNKIGDSQLAYGSMAPRSDVRFFSSTTIREKCEACNSENPVVKPIALYMRTKLICKWTNASTEYSVVITAIPVRS